MALEALEIFAVDFFADDFFADMAYADFRFGRTALAGAGLTSVRPFLGAAEADFFATL